MLEKWPTLEVRWFFQGDIPESVATWFQQGDTKPDHPEPRVDHYLHLPETDALGIKLREGKIEVKQRHRDYGTVHLTERAAGTLEKWHKWSFPLAASQGQVVESLAPSAAWIAVRKERWVRKHRVLAGRQVEPVPLAAYPDRGCTLELVSIVVGHSRAWSLAFEAFGEEEALLKSLFRTAEHRFSTCGMLDLDVVDSFGYPRWLQDHHS
jgi:hypothetical protein